MRNSRDRWRFFKHETKKPLTAAEVSYWRSIQGILKVGLEFEFNLPDKNGTCRGDSPTCPCKHMATSTCWKKCKNIKHCERNKNINRCANKTEKCRSDDCANCDYYKLECCSIFCPDFVSICLDCDKFEINCDNCADKYDPKKNPKNIREAVSKKLSPSNCYGLVSRCGVHSITQDGSLLGDKGMEVVTVGRRVNYWEFHNMAKEIIDSAISKGAFVNERCSTHMHLLASYYGKLGPSSRTIDHTNSIPGIPSNISELEKPMPEIILSNFHQLCRKYQNAMTWMTIALDEPKRMTRWEKFRASVLHVSGALNSMRRVRDIVYNEAGNSKYGWVNYSCCEFDKKGDITRFHVEMRAPDGILSPSAVAALACMHCALFIKSVEISRYGVLEMEDKEWLEQAKEIKQAILNNFPGPGNFGDDRFGDTSNVMKYADTLRADSYDLIRQLKHVLIKFGPSYQILEKIAEKPIALRRCDGQSWEEIEADLEVPMNEEGQFEMKMAEYIDLRLVDQCNSVEEWVKAVSLTLETDSDLTGDKEHIEERVETYVELKRNEGELIWSDTLGSVVTV